MRIPPIDDEAADRILALFKKQKARPGHPLKDGYVLKNFADDRLRLDDFKGGCDYAIEQGWITTLEPGVYVLTQEGFSRLPCSVPL
jgi:hypothetical protein